MKKEELMTTLNKHSIILIVVLSSFIMIARGQDLHNDAFYEALHIERIDSIDNQERPLVNNVYIIYAVNIDSTQYKIFTHFDKKKRINEMSILETGRWYIIPLESILQGPLSKIGAQYLRAPGIAVTGTNYYGNEVSIEPSSGIYDLHISPKLNGLYFSQNDVYPFTCESNADGQIIIPIEFRDLMSAHNEKINECCNACVMAEPHESDDIFENVKEMPEFVGGQDAFLKYINRNVQYPSSAIISGIQAKILISFVVEKDGSVSNVATAKFENVFNRGETKELLKTRNNLSERDFTVINAELQAEAERVVKMMPKWIPGKNDGKRVRARMTIPVNFWE